MDLIRLRTIVLVASLGGATTAHAAEAPPAAKAAPDVSAGVDAEAQRHATLGQRFLERGEGQRAVGEFRRAYELRADARFLFDIAESYERIGLDDQARFFYDRYLRAAPDALDRDEVEERLGAIDKRTAGAKPPVPSALPAPAPPSFAHDVVVLPVADTPPPRPLWKRWWPWASLGALVAGTAVAIYALDRALTPAPATSLGDKTFY
jgi:tetratricopeptide (TPR) repeat protein